MKFVVLALVILFILLFFKILSSRNSKTNIKNNKTTIDLEKDPKTNEYKPKKQIVISLQSIIMKLKISDIIENLKETPYSGHYGF